MKQGNILFVGNYISEDVSGSHRQERFVLKALESGYMVTYIKPAGNWVGSYVFDSVGSFLSWKSEHKPAIFKGSISSNRFKKYLLPLKYLFFLDIFGLGFFRTIWLLHSRRYLFSTNYSLIVSSPSFELVVAVYFYSLFCNRTEFTVDMRDAWAYHKNLTIFKGIRKIVERRVLRRAIKVVSVSNYLKEEFEMAHDISVDLLYNVNLNLLSANNHDETVVINPFRVDGVNVCYFGSIPRGFYNLNEFCKGLQLYFQSEDKGICFHFYGPCEELALVVENFPLVKENFRFYPSVAHSEALYLMRSSDIVLFLGYNADKNAGMVSTKIFEYFYLKLRILAFGIRENSDLDYLFQNLCGTSVIINDASNLFQYLMDGLNDLDYFPVCKNPEFLEILDQDYKFFINSLQ
jgi:hypothetical protein